MTARAAKRTTPIEFRRTDDRVYQCRSDSDPQRWYNVLVTADNEAMCCCQGAMRHGVNGCKHAKALVEQGLAIYAAEPLAHRATVREDCFCNFHVDCFCGLSTCVASKTRDRADEIANQHNNPRPRRSLFDE